MAITQSTATLVKAAAQAQEERVAKGRQHEGPMYKADPAWAEGLISAAKAVAAATQKLVMVANDVAEGRTEGAEEALIVAARAVSAATAQLVAATASKSDPNSSTQAGLNAAAKAVQNATAMLVAAAKALMKLVDDSSKIDYSRLSVHQFKVKEMEQQTLILKLEKEVDRARKELFRMRKEYYSKQEAQAAVVAETQTVHAPDITQGPKIPTKTPSHAAPPAQSQASHHPPQAASGRKLPTPKAFGAEAGSEEDAEFARLQRYTNRQ